MGRRKKKREEEINVKKGNWEREFEEFKKDIKLRMENEKGADNNEGDEEGRRKIQELEKVAEDGGGKK